MTVEDLLVLLSAYGQQTDCGTSTWHRLCLVTRPVQANVHVLARLWLATSDPGTSQFATVSVDDHVGDFIAGQPVTISFTDAQNCNADGACLWDDWVSIVPVTENPDWTNYQDGHWAYHGSGEAGSGSVTVTPAEFGDYFVVLLGGADGYTELTDPDNRLIISVVNWVPLAEPVVTVGDCRVPDGSHGCDLRSGTHSALCHTRVLVAH